MSEPELLPRREELHVEEKKVLAYLLNPDNPDSKLKARYFTRRGFTREAWPVFAEALRAHGRRGPSRVRR